MSDTDNYQLSNAETAVHPHAAEKQTLTDSPDLTAALQSHSSNLFTVYPPRTGLLRVGWYKRSSQWRPYPSSCSAGLALVSVTTFTLGLILCQAKSVTSPAILSGAFFFASGLVQIITGIWAIVDNNLFGSVLLLCLGAFFMSMGAIVSDVFGTSSAYTTADDLNNALGIYLSSWTVFAFFLWTATFKSTAPLFVLTLFNWIFMLLYTIATFGDHEGVKVASGVFCFLVSMCGFYATYDGLMAANNSYAPIPESKWLRMPGSWNAPEETNNVGYC
ncbi:hypothetical protein CANARDRAFT_8694 [[Candida] arabinofermentans NRRL YB-2248]|uniref:Acetate transporter n=1 Tax=[Candida] arabinofermentans NRRL YB-2248 TaxID=983967 RepID=A0A1E4SXW7_9ASCO|nr:hypothetical protein CANARDRAFT_8694 [[Candida] arabinofermentans NRRL YB-2248]